MRTDVDYRKKENVMYSKNVWVHSGLSELAKATRPEEDLLRKDSDVLIYDYVTSFWMRDILLRKDDVDDCLYETAVELEFANNFQVSQHPEILDMFVSLRQHFGHVYKVNNRYSTGEKTGEEKLQALQHAQEFDFDILVKDYYVDDLVQKLVKLIIQTPYEPCRELVDKVLQDDTRDFYPHGYYPSIAERIDKQYQLYLLMVILYPHDNLPDYLHDQMVYRDNNERDHDIVDNRTLLQQHIDDDVLNYSVKKVVSMFDE